MTGTVHGSGIIGLGKSLPKKKITNAELSKKLKVPAETFLVRSGIESRYYAEKEETASQISAKAARAAIHAAGIQVQDIGWIIGGTSTGDYRFPAMACKVQD